MNKLFLNEIKIHTQKNGKIIYQNVNCDNFWVFGLQIIFIFYYNIFIFSPKSIYVYNQEKK